MSCQIAKTKFHLLSVFFAHPFLHTKVLTLLMVTVLVLSSDILGTNEFTLFIVTVLVPSSDPVRGGEHSRLRLR